MSAFLYISSSIEAADKKYGKAFLDAVSRNRRQQTASTRRKTKELLDDLYPKRACFEDPYTLRGVLWTWQISWETDIRDLLVNGKLPVIEIVRLYRKLTKNFPLPVFNDFERRADEPRFATAVRVLEKKPNILEAWHRYYTKRRRELQTLLQRAANARSTIDVDPNL